MTKSMIVEFEKMVMKECHEAIRSDVIDLFHCMDWNTGDRFKLYENHIYDNSEGDEIIEAKYTHANILLIQKFIEDNEDDEFDENDAILGTFMFILDKCLDDTLDDLNVARNKYYKQVCVWPGTLINGKIGEFEDYIYNEFNVHIKYLEEIVTLPDTGDTTGETGGRNDVFFSIYRKDINKFAIPRLHMGIRWIEDVLSEVNGYNENPIYPDRVFKYQSWETEE